MIKKLRALFKKQTVQMKETSRSSRVKKGAPVNGFIQNFGPSSREISGHDSWQTNFENIRNMLKGFSKRMESIKNNPEESYLINTEVSLRLLEVLEHLAKISEQNALSLERIGQNTYSPIPKVEGSDKKRRAREVTCCHTFTVSVLLKDSIFLQIFIRYLEQLLLLIGRIGNRYFSFKPAKKLC
jgi:hypothetical protein